jgi:hypothetical protein
MRLSLSHRLAMSLFPAKLSHERRRASSPQPMLQQADARARSTICSSAKPVVNGRKTCAHRQ